LLKLEIAPRLATDAANPDGIHDVNQIAHMLNARHMPHRFLHQLLEVERRQLAREHERATAVLDKNITDATAKVRVMFQVLPGQRAQIVTFARLGRRLFH
jgi:4-hydroxyphenylpyruvate dioxygenase-like putative hemolysin